MEDRWEAILMKYWALLVLCFFPRYQPLLQMDGAWNSYHGFPYHYCANFTIKSWLAICLKHSKFDPESAANSYLPGMIQIGWMCRFSGLNPMFCMHIHYQNTSHVTDIFSDKTSTRRYLSTAHMPCVATTHCLLTICYLNQQLLNCVHVAIRWYRSRIGLAEYVLHYGCTDTRICHFLFHFSWSGIGDNPNKMDCNTRDHFYYISCIASNLASMPQS